jgi:hypothetical protein
MMALRSPASASPTNSQFFLPMAVGRMAFSTRLCRVPDYAEGLTFSHWLDVFGTTDAA